MITCIIRIVAAMAWTPAMILIATSWQLGLPISAPGIFCIGMAMAMSAYWTLAGALAAVVQIVLMRNSHLDRRPKSRAS